MSAWLDSHARQVDPGDRGLAASALDRVVGEHSELAELWDEAPNGDAWRAGIASLRATLSG